MKAPRGQLKLLIRMFFGRLFESDMMPPGLPQVQLLVWVAAFLLGPSLVGPILLGKKYAWLRTAGEVDLALSADRTIALLFSLIAIGIITLVIWEGIFPDKRDGRILGVLPITAGAIVTARLATLSAVFAIFVAATALPGAIAFGALSGVFGASDPLGTAVGHLVATAGAQAVLFFGVVLLQCVVLNTAGAAVAHRLAVVLQVLMVVGLFQMPMILPVLASPRIAEIAPVAAILTSGAALLLYAASYRRLTKLALEGLGGTGTHQRPLRRVLPAIARALPVSQPARAVFAFTVRTVVRSRQHRMLLAGWVGLALALIISSIAGAAVRGGWQSLARPNPVVLSAPLILAALTMTGMRMLFAIPSEIRANWSIRVRQPLPVVAALDGATTALIVCGVLPAIVVAFTSATFLWGLATGLEHALYCAVLATLLAEVLSVGLDKVPFTCTYVPGKGRIVKLWPLYLTIFSFYTGGMAALEAEVLRRGGFSTAVGVFLVLIVGADYVRRWNVSGLPDLRFEEQPLDSPTLVSL